MSLLAYIALVLSSLGIILVVFTPYKPLGAILALLGCLSGLVAALGAGKEEQ